MKKKSRPKKIKKTLVNLHMYGLFNRKTKEMLKVSLDESEIQMEIALIGGMTEHLVECEFDMQLSI